MTASQMTSASYEVSYRKPPRYTQFQKGQSGNPGGRPKTVLLSQAYREKLAEVDPKTGKTHAELIAIAQAVQAKRGNVHAARWIADRTEGKVPMQVTAEVEVPEVAEAINRFMERTK